MADYTKYNWEDRVSQYPSQRKLTVQSATGSSGLAANDVIVATVERDDGNVDVVGTPFSKATMDTMENNISAAFSHVRSVKVIYLSNSTNGQLNDFDLYEECNNFDTIGIYYVSRGGQISGYTEINGSDASEICCSLSYPGNNDGKFHFRSAYLTIGNDWKHVSFARRGHVEAEFYTTSGGGHSAGDWKTAKLYSDADQAVGIKRVLGYKVVPLT